MEKTNVMRILDQKKIPYELYHCENNDEIDGISVAEKLGLNPEMVFKTIVLVSSSRKNYVGIVPVLETLDLKKYAKIVNEKSVDTLPLKELTTVTGYIRGGCSPIGMKKQFKTIIHQTAESHEKVVISAGHIGYYVAINYLDLLKIMPICVDNIAR